MSFAKKSLGRDTVVAPLSGAPCVVPSVLDFTRSRPAVPKGPGAGPLPVPPHRSAVLRYRPALSGKMSPVDPTYLAFHLDFGEGGRVVRISEALLGFVARVCAAAAGSGGTRTVVGGSPAVCTRAVSRGTELNLEPRSIFGGAPCQVRGCGAARAAGVFCAAHYDSTFSGGLTRRDIRARSKTSILITPAVRAEMNLVFGPFDGFWLSVCAWLGGPAVSKGRARAYVVNHAVDQVPRLSLGTHSADRLAAIVYCTHPVAGGSQAFFNACLAVLYVRTLRERFGMLARRVAHSLSEFYLAVTPDTESGAAATRDQGIVTYLKMPVLPTVEEFVGHTIGLLGATQIPDAEERPVTAVFNMGVLRVMARIFGSVGTFSFSVLAGSLELPAGAHVLDAAEPLDISKFSALTGADRADRVLYVVSPAALSTTVLWAIMTRLAFKHVYFCGPVLGAAGIALPTFEDGAADPVVGFYWACLVDEARVRGLIRCLGTGDPLWRHPPESGGFLGTFVIPSTPVRCESGCRTCTATSHWHTDRLLTEAAYGDEVSEVLPRCARAGIDRFQAEAVEQHIHVWRTLCDLTLTTHF